MLRTTKMPVTEITGKMKVLPDNVYVIQPGTNIALLNGVLQVMPRTDNERRPYTSIDYFLRSLAEDQRNKSIGIILSGTGSDGTEGLKAIKAEGGITFAQDPGSSKYDAMPRTAIDAGVIDLILPASEIAGELTSLGKHPYVARPSRLTDKTLGDTEDAFTKILILLRSAKGVDFSYYKKSTIMRRIDRRMAVNKTEDLEDYLELLQKKSDETHLLFSDILITVTRFFRDTEVFESLIRDVYPAITQNKGANEQIRIWIPGCSSGEEAYSIAISLLEYIEKLEVKPQIHIFATDINEATIEKARHGKYPESIESDVSQARLNKFFIKVRDGYQINSTVRELCIFARHDITKDAPLSNMDLISCRNLLIYLGSVLQKKVIPTFHFSLKQNGFLLLGTSESVGQFDSLFKTIEPKQRIYTKKPSTTRIVPLNIAPSYHTAENALNSNTKRIDMKASEGARAKESYDPLMQADNIVLSRYSPAGVVVDEDLQILQFRGKTSFFLEPAPGRASLNLLNMARHGLGLDIRTLVQKAKKTGSIARKEKVRIEYAKKFGLITLEVVPLQSPTGYYNFLILFKEEPRESGDKKAGQAKAKNEINEGPDNGNLENELLRKELDETKAYLRSVIEDKEASNEELQSSAEELQSTNEELEAAKEELQSSNEELTTLNEELRIRNNELTQLGDDRSNILNSVNIPIIMLDNELRIRTVTPLTEKLLNLTVSDIGQIITKMKLKFEIPKLEAIIQNSIEGVTLNETEILDSNSRWLLLQVRPYITMNKQIGGAVMSFIDIDEAKRSSQMVEESRDFAESIVKTVREPLVVLDSDLRVISVNPAFDRTFQTLPGKNVGRQIYNLGSHQWDIPPLRDVIEKVLKTDASFEDFEVEYNFPQIGHKIMLLNARKIEQKTIGDKKILLAIEDITERKQQEKELQRARELGSALNNINDAVSSTLDFNQIIQKVVKQGAEAIGCDSAAVELKENDQWSVKYTYNLHEDMVGKQLTGKQALITKFVGANKQAIAVPDTMSNYSLNSKIMQHHNIKSFLAVPLRTKEETHGILIFINNKESATFDDQQIDFCEKLAVSVALSLENARLYESQSSIAHILQETLLTVPPKLKGIETGSVYHSATQTPGAVGGDFYDVFMVEDDKLAITIGDVAGKGIEAAKLTGFIKNTIRAYARYDFSPSAVMTRTCETVGETLTETSFVTVFFGILNIKTGALIYCSAGHPPAFIKRVETLNVEILQTESPALISLDNFEYVNSKSQLEKGDILVLYTDGVIEARQDREFYGEERLLDFITGTKILSAKKLCNSLFDEVISFTGGSLSDDVAILTVQLKK